MGQKRETLQVPIIYNDLRHEETTVQIAVAFSYLNIAMKSVFDHVNTSINNNKIRLSKLQQRSNVVKTKVEMIAGTNRATKVFSSGKYPAAYVNKDYEYKFQASHIEPDIDESQIKIRAPIVTHSLQDKSKFFYVKKENKVTLQKNVELQPDEGLGRIPDDFEYISSLVLFNTAENLYNDYVLSDPLYVFNKTRPKADVDDKNELEAAPKTMSVAEKMHYKGPHYFYSPILEDVPAIDVPLDLPDLPGIAGDMCYDISTDAVIAPSLASAPQVKELQDFDISPNNKTSGVEITVPVTIPSPSPSLLEPSLPSLPSIKDNTVLTPPQLPPPPPPPPPPMPPQSIFNPSDTESTDIIASPDVLKVSLPDKETVSSTDAIQNLMAEIRNAGGSGKAKLKSVTERKLEVKRAKMDECEPKPGGNLMADLHAKLAMRRKGISGQKADGGNETPIEKMFLNSNVSSKGSETDDDGEWDE